MAKPVTDDAEEQLDAFIDKLIEEKDNLPSTELDDKFWKVRWNNGRCRLAVRRFIQDLERHPLFLKEMPTEGDELHPATAALQALKWDDDDDSPLGLNEEISILFRHWNNSFRSSREI